MSLRTIAALAALGILSPAVWAQSYPSKPVRVIVTFPPGGTPDIYGRVMSAELQKIWNQSVVVENRTGAGGTIGTDYVAKAAPDGYTLLFAADATITIAPHLYSKLPYDSVRDLAPIVNVAAGPFVLMANPAFAPNSVKELIALVQTQPGKVSYASSGAGGQQHLAMEYIRTMAGSMDMIHVPYKGFGQGIADVLANQVPLIFGGITASIQLTRTGTGSSRWETRRKNSRRRSRPTSRTGRRSSRPPARSSTENRGQTTISRIGRGNEDMAPGKIGVCPRFALAALVLFTALAHAQDPAAGY